MDLEDTARKLRAWRLTTWEYPDPLLPEGAGCVA